MRTALADLPDVAGWPHPDPVRPRHDDRGATASTASKPLDDIEPVKPPRTGERLRAAIVGLG